MSMSFNEFNRQLQNRNIDKNVAFMLAIVYERLMDLGNQQVECAKICEVLANATAKTVAMQKADQESLAGLIRTVKGNQKGIEVHSEPISNEPTQ